MTDIEILTNCINEMARINIPAGLIEQIGLPIYNIRQELINLANNIIEKANKAEKISKEENDDIKTEEDNQNGSEVE
jgi:hypothetical protein